MSYLSHIKNQVCYVVYELVYCAFTFASELWQNNAHALSVKCMNPKGECIGQASKWKQKWFILSQFSSIKFYAVINLIHTRHNKLVFKCGLYAHSKLQKPLIFPTKHNYPFSKWNNPTREWIHHTQRSHVRMHRARCSECKYRNNVRSLLSRILSVINSD